ncbi:MAG: DUF5610 domain-containing protein [Magnetococcales bacterium]|nr:DUF5610 domain-containing protein [Magnetococcales bacterium]
MLTLQESGSLDLYRFDNRASGSRSAPSSLIPTPSTQKADAHAVHEVVSLTDQAAMMQAQRLLLEETIAELNGYLASTPDLEPIGSPDLQELTPETTANYIVSMATSFFDQYAQAHPEMDPQEQLDSYMGLVGGAIDKGFQEAREILGALNLMTESVTSTIDETYSLVQVGLDAFYETTLALLTGVESGETSGEVVDLTAQIMELDAQVADLGSEMVVDPDSQPRGGFSAVA